jgi:hypothetical protein
VDIRVIQVSGEQNVEIVCSNCWKIGSIPVARIPTAGKKYKIKCKCGGTSIVRFEKRRHHRKTKNLFGVVIINGRELLVDIKDLSINGCSFTHSESGRKWDIGNKLSVRFRLDNPHSDLIECFGIVKNLHEPRIGVEFINIPDQVRKILGFHFFS